MGIRIFRVFTYGAPAGELKVRTKTTEQARGSENKDLLIAVLPCGQELAHFSWAVALSLQWTSSDVVLLENSECCKRPLHRKKLRNVPSDSQSLWWLLRGGVENQRSVGKDARAKGDLSRQTSLCRAFV